jgi:hypothetical protein
VTLLQQHAQIARHVRIFLLANVARAAFFPL